MRETIGCKRVADRPTSIEETGEMPGSSAYGRRADVSLDEPLDPTDPARPGNVQRIHSLVSLASQPPPLVEEADRVRHVPDTEEPQGDQRSAQRVALAACAACERPVEGRLDRDAPPDSSRLIAMEAEGALAVREVLVPEAAEGERVRMADDGFGHVDELAAAEHPASAEVSILGRPVGRIEASQCEEVITREGKVVRGEETRVVRLMVVLCVADGDHELARSRVRVLVQHVDRASAEATLRPQR